MRTVIDIEIIENYGLTLDEFMLIMVVGNKIDFTTAEKTLREKKLIMRSSEPPLNVSLTKKACTLYEDIVMEASKMLDNPKKYENLAKKLIDIYPKGWKDGTYQWVEGPILVARRLQMFELKYGKYSDEDIVNATQRYVNIMFGKPEMRLLKYFIFKEKQTSTGEYESSSDLYGMLTNKQDTLFEADEWKTELV